MTAPNIRDRIIELRRVRASELVANPKNWRTHPEPQRAALRAIIADVGFAGAALARIDDAGALVIIDGHLRQDVAGDEVIPVLVTDLSEAEGDRLLAVYDPIGAMAEANAAAMQDLLASVELPDSLFALASALAPASAAVDATQEYTGMPEYVQPARPAFKSVVIHFDNQEAVEAFEKLIGRAITARYMWYPETPSRARRAPRGEE